MTTPKPNYPWIVEALNCIGTTEIKGLKHNSKILGWLQSLRAWWSDDETPWCGTFAAHCIKTAGLSLPKHWYRAKDWLNWGAPISVPAHGCIVVFDRKGGGHVGFVVGKDKLGNLLVLGGNQGDAVNIRAFPITRVSGYRWPKELPVPKPVKLAVGSAAISVNEA